MQISEHTWYVIAESKVAHDSRVVNRWVWLELLEGPNLWFTLVDNSQGRLVGTVISIIVACFKEPLPVIRMPGSKNVEEVRVS